MARDLSCPNPSCSHVFAPPDVAGVAALVCPKCGGVYQVKTRKLGPTASPVVASRNAVRRTAAPAWLTAGLIIVICIGLLAAAMYRQRPVTQPTGPEPFRSTEHNYSFLMPAAPWQRDDDLAKRLAGVLAFRRENPDAAVVFAVREYPKFVPMMADLRDDAVSRLRKLPVERLQFDDKSDGATFAGKPSGRFVFQASLDGMQVSGDVHYLTHEGRAYWLYRWCPAVAVNQVAADLADMAGRFALLDLRPNWQPPRRHFIGTKLPYTLTAEGDRWEKAPYPPPSYDPAADVALVGRPQSGPPDALRQAQALVILLPAGDGPPVQRAKEHLLARQEELYPETKLTDLETMPATDNLDAIVELRVTNTKDRERFVVLGVAARAKELVVIWAECDFARRNLWDADFRDLVGSFKLAQ